MPVLYEIKCIICHQYGDIVHCARKSPRLCDLFGCNDLRKLLPDLRNQSFAIRMVNKTQSQKMRDFPSPPLQFGSNGEIARDAEDETEQALNQFILDLAYTAIAKSADAQSTCVQSVVR